jgi:arylsulfatase A-like enzyme
VIDDIGFGSTSCSGGPIETPAIDRLAGGGLLYTNFHTTPLCSPTRASLLTGRNHHSVGMGVLVDHVGVEGEGYTRRVDATTAGVGAYLRASGYRTACIGKWHLTPSEETEVGDASDRWPTAPMFGFDRYYGFIGGSTNQWYPDLWEDDRPVEPPRTPREGYHLSEDLVDRAIAFTDERADTPWFLYLAFGATHEPHQVGPEWIAPYRGRFDRGWDAVREETLVRQLDRGLVPQGTKLAPMFPDTPRWADLSDLERTVFARMMEVFAGFATHTDAQIGRLVEHLRTTDQLRDTLVLVLVGDNGAAAEGGSRGIFNRSPIPLAEVAEHLDELGGPTSRIEYPAGWGMAMNAPFRYSKSHAHLGGCRNPLVVHWPEGFEARGEHRAQFHHVIDVVPTILDVTGLLLPEELAGFRQRPLEGITMGPTFDDPGAPERHDTQYFEMLGNRAIYHRGWRAVTLHTRDWRPVVASFDEDRWELYHLEEDWSECRDLAEREPERLRAMIALWEREAERFRVLPLNRDIAFWERHRLERRVLREGAMRVRGPAGGSVTIGRSWTLRCAVELDRTPAAGTIAAEGGLGGGWRLSLDEGRPAFRYNFSGLEPSDAVAPHPLGPGRHEIGVTFEVEPREGAVAGASVTLDVSGVTVARGTIPRVAEGFYAFDGGLDVGADRGSPVSARPAADAFSGRIYEVIVEPLDP